MLDPDGKPRSDPFVIGSISPLGPPAIPLRLAADGTGYAAAWPGLSFARLDAAGHHRGGDPRLLDSLVPASFTLAWSGTSYLLTWPYGPPTVLRYLVLDADLTPLAGPRTLGVAGEGGSWFRGVRLGDRFAVAWLGPDSGDPLGSDSTRPLCAARFDRRGRLLGPPTTTPDTAAPLPGNTVAMSAASGANSIAVVVSSYGGLGDEHIDLRLIRFDREGIFVEQVELLDVIHETISPDPSGPLGIAFDGSGFGVLVSTTGGEVVPLLLRWALLPWRALPRFRDGLLGHQAATWTRLPGSHPVGRVASAPVVRARLWRGTALDRFSMVS